MVLDWRDSPAFKQEKRESERKCRKTKTRMTLSLSFSFCFVTSSGETSNLLIESLDAILNHEQLLKS